MFILILQGILSHSNIFVRINRTSSNMSISVTAKNQPTYRDIAIVMSFAIWGVKCCGGKSHVNPFGTVMSQISVTLYHIFLYLYLISKGGEIKL